MEYEPIWALFQGFEPLFGRIWMHQGEKSDPDLDPQPYYLKIRIRIRVISRIRIHNNAVPQYRCV